MLIIKIHYFHISDIYIFTLPHIINDKLGIKLIENRDAC